MADIIVTLIILSIIGLSISRIITEKRRGSKCVGCSLSAGCSSNKMIKSKVIAQRIEIKELT